MVSKRSYILKQTCSFQLQVCLSMCDLFVTTRHYRVKMQISIQTDNQNQRKKMLQPMKTASRKMSLKFQNPSFNILCKTTLWNKQIGLNKELIIWSGLLRWKGSLLGGTVLKNDKSYLQENVWSQRTNPACIRQHKPAR